MRTVFRTGELIAMHGRGAVRHAIAVGRWQSPCRGVVVTHAATLSADELECVALMLCAPGSALAGVSSLAHDRLTGFESSAVHIVLPEGADKPDSDGLPPGLELVTHWSTDLSADDVHPLREPRRTRRARSLVDAASWSGSDRHARALILAGLQQGLVDEGRMHRAIDRRGTCRRRALIRESVLDAVGGVQSLPERDFGEICRTAGLPAPTRQTKLQTPAGRYYLDATWDQLDLTVEVHGSQHQQVRSWDADLRRGNEVAIDGRRQLVFTSYAVRHEKQQVAGQLLRMFRSLGWHPPATEDEGFG